ncbi:ORF2 [Hogweed virus 4]|uniref:ORF2 n=1 Tax=Hogweed virus 4 TaxID=2913660 RepID=UPI002481A504|nr:ORF2 [Hogweed virus 4]UKQ12873.1 ORF2 [Hogweed virus 4]
MSLIDVNKFCSLVSKGQSSVEAISSTSIYGDASWLKLKSITAIRKFESNISLELEDGETNLVVPNVPLISDSEIRAVKKNMPNVNFVHLGGLVISIQALFAANKGVKGTAILVDRRWRNLEQAIIGSFNFNLDKRRADFMMRPNFDVSMSDPLLSDSLSIMLHFNNLDMFASSIPINLSIGLIARFYNTIDPGVRIISDELDFQGLIGSEGISQADMLANLGDIKDLFNDSAIFKPTIVNNRKFDRGLFKDKGFIKQIKGSRSADYKAISRTGSMKKPQSSSFQYDRLKVDPLVYDKIKREQINNWVQNELPIKNNENEEGNSDEGSSRRVEVFESPY